MAQTVDVKIDEVVCLLVEIRKRLRPEYDKIDAMREKLMTDVQVEPPLFPPGVSKPNLSSLDPTFKQLSKTIEECETEMNQSTTLHREFILQIARVLMSIQKELQNVFNSDAIPELNTPFQGVGLAMKAALSGNMEQLSETLEKLKVLPQTLVERGYIENDVRKRRDKPSLSRTNGASKLPTPPNSLRSSRTTHTLRSGSRGATKTPISTSSAPMRSTLVPKPIARTTTTASRDLKDIQKSTNFGKAELEKLQSLFKSYDRSKKGSLDAIGFRQLMRNLHFFPGVSDTTLDGLFKTFDRDGSGTVEFSELAACLSVLSKGSPEDKLGFMFDAYDTDGSGYLERDEIAAVMNQMKLVARALGREPGKVQQFINGVLNKIDADNSGDISREEWVSVGCRTPSLLTLLSGESSTLNLSSEKKSRKIHPASMKELEGKTQFGKDELKKLKIIFTRNVSDIKYGLNPAEFKKTVRDLSIFPGISEDSLDGFFIAFDNDGSGTIDFSELCIALSIISRGTIEEKLGYMFDAYDTDHSGYLDPSEVRTVTAQMKIVAEALGRDPQRIEPFILNIVKKTDVDGDGKISRSEWIEVGSSTPSLLQLLAGGDWVNSSDSFSAKNSGSIHSSTASLSGSSIKNSGSKSYGITKKGTLTSSCITELRSKTNFGKKELMELSKTFKQFDTDGSNDLNQGEFKDLLKYLKLFPGIAETTLDSFFRSFDNDGSGTIDFPELCTALSVLSKGSLEEKLGFVFDTYDVDGSGELDRSEVYRVTVQMQVVAEALGRDAKKMEPFINNILKKVDVAGTGSLLRTDWIRVGLQTPSLMSLLVGGEWT